MGPLGPASVSARSRNRFYWVQWVQLDFLLASATDAAAINSGGEHDKAVARRAVIFCVDESLFEEGAQGATDAVGLELWRAEQANATPLDEGA